MNLETLDICRGARAASSHRIGTNVLEGKHLEALKSSRDLVDAMAIASTMAQRSQPSGGDARSLGETPSLVNHLANVAEGSYDAKAALLLSAASTWAYSDLDTFARLLTRGGLNEASFAALSFTNDALLLDSAAYMVQSADRRVAILCFRGTQPLNLIDWLTDASGKPDPFEAVGPVHGGFNRAVRAMWPTIRDLLEKAQQGRSISAAELDPAGLNASGMGRQESLLGRLGAHVDEIQRLAWTLKGVLAGNELARRLKDLDELVAKLKGCSPEELHAAPEGVRELVARLEKAVAHARSLSEPTPPDEPQPQPGTKLEALYITGHSLGGAMAVLATALIYADDRLRSALGSTLRGVYTFGQPMVGSKAFAEKCAGDFGHKLFRHIYKWDVVPTLPPRTMGEFAHFGQEYEAVEAGWQSRRGAVAQSRIGSVSIALGVSAWIMDQLQIFREQPVLRDLSFLVSRAFQPPSLADHSPLNYLRTSHIVRPGIEFD